MASLYKRPRSPFWWIKFRDAAGAVRCESTGLRVGRGDDYRRAQDLRAERTLAERKSGTVHHAEHWPQWVPQYIDLAAGRTQERYLSAWRSLRIFFEEKEITAPRQLTYQHCADYMPWRLKPNKARGKWRAGRNTAILELKVLRWLLREAVRRGYAPGNPARELVLRREPRKLFPEYTRDQLEQIADAIEREPDEAARTQLRNSFLIARYHGVRLRETNVNPVRDVQLWPSDRPTAAHGLEGSIRFHQKGGKVKDKPLHPKLIPLFQDLIARKQTTTYPPAAWSGRWFRFLVRAGLKAQNPNACFHSLRVTVKNQLDAAGVPTEIVREYLSHTPQDVHSSYGRFANLDKLRICHAAVG